MDVGRTTNADSVLIDEVHAFLRVDHIAFSCAVHVSLLDVEVSACFLHTVSTLVFFDVPDKARRWNTYLPANLYGRVHDHVGLVVGLARSLALVLPKLLLGQYSQLCPVSLRASKIMLLCALTIMASEDPMVDVPIVFASSWLGALNSLAIIETHPVRYSANMSNASNLYCIRTVLNICADRVLFVIDEVLREGVAGRYGYSDGQRTLLDWTYTMSFSASSSCIHVSACHTGVKPRDHTM